MHEHNAILRELEIKHAQKLMKQHGIVCRQLPFGNSSPLYLAKPHWGNRFDEGRESTIGIFCSVWVDPKMLKKDLYSYNIHAKSLQKLPGYQLKPKQFASDFRSLVQSSVADWPGISLNYGPSTLLMGTQTSELQTFAEKVEEQILGYVDIHQHIDALLEQALSTAAKK